MTTKALDRDGLEDWHGNNAAVRCPICGKTYLVSGFIAKGQRQCPKCHQSRAELSGEQVIIEYPDAVDKIQLLTRSELQTRGRLDEFVGLIAEGGAVRRASVDAKLPKAEKIAFLERNERMAAVAALKKTATSSYAAYLREKSGYAISPDLPEIGYVAVADGWKGLHLSSPVFDKILGLCAGNVFATTSEPKMKCTLAKRRFRWVGREWLSSECPTKHLSLWLRET